jgi:hypothetical protein
MSVDLTRKASQLIIYFVTNEIFGSVCRETNPPAINIKGEKDKQAQIMNITPPVRNVSIQDINLVLLRKKERLSSKITGCTITPNGKFIFDTNLFVFSR